MLTIVWDVDDVLNDLMLVWFNAQWKPSHPECKLSYADICENPPDRVLGIDRCEYLASIDSFRLSEPARSMRPNSVILDWLHRYGDQYRHVALTARPLDSVPYLAEWLFRHFGAFFRCFGVVPSRLDASAPVYDQNKRDFLAWFRQADLFVDDSPENVAAVEALGVRSILYPQPWNHGSGTAADVLAFLREQAVAV